MSSLGFSGLYSIKKSGLQIPIIFVYSLTEYPSYWGEHPELFAACAEGQDDVEQMAHVLRWFIGTLKGQYMSRNASMGSEKKVSTNVAHLCLCFILNLDYPTAAKPSLRRAVLGNMA